MGYLPSNPYNAIVNCKIGGLNLTPIPPNALESFTFERDTTTGGNKFTIVVHDETAILIESYLAEVASKGNEGQSYDFGSGSSMVGVPDALLPDDKQKKVDDTLAMLGGSTTSPSSSDAETQAIRSYSAVLPIPISTLAIGGEPFSPSSIDGDSETELRAADTVEIRMKTSDGRTFPTDNQSALRGGGIDETNSVVGSAGTQVSSLDSPDRADEVRGTVIDNSRLVHANPSYGLREVYGVAIPEGVWMSEDALKEHSGGRGDG